MIRVGATTRLSVMLFKFTFQGYRLHDRVKKRSSEQNNHKSRKLYVAPDISIVVHQHPFSLAASLTKTNV